MKLEKNHVILAIMLVIIVASIAIIGFKNPKYTANAIKSENVGISIGDFAPDFELESIAGGKARLSDFNGKAIILNFWATWCPPCKEEMPLFENVYRSDSDIVVIGVNLQENRKNVVDFIEKFDISFPILLDSNSEVKGLYNVFTQPVTYFIDENGIIVDKKFGPLTNEEINEKVDKLLK